LFLEDGSMADWRIAPVLVVSEIESSVRYYRDRLKFQIIGSFGSPMEMAFVGAHGIQLMLQHGEGRPIPGPNSKYKSVAWDAILWVDDARALHEQLSNAGASIRRAPYKTFYGHIEFETIDPDGYVFCFSQGPTGPAA
jgi:catechol 2,3-dioxygenase-like lactoylglutathione lyase family enzyme